MMYRGDKKDTYCKRCKKKQTWVKCENRSGRGPTWSTTCRYKCTGGYKRGPETSERIYVHK